VKLCCVLFTELEDQLVSTDEQICREDNQLSYWKQFCEKGQHDNDKTIHLLEQELVDMEASFTEISSTTITFFGELTWLPMDKLLYICSLYESQVVVKHYSCMFIDIVWLCIYLHRSLAVDSEQRKGRNRENYSRDSQPAEIPCNWGNV